MIPYGRQDVVEADIEAVGEVLRSDWLTQGPTVQRFEEAIVKYCGGSYAVAVNSATSALHLACLALDVGPGDIGWTTPNTFVATANCLRYCGASVDFVDIDPTTLNMDVEALEEKLRIARAVNKLPKVLIPVHFAGRSCEMKRIWLLAEEYGVKVIEDASHALGAEYLGEKIGKCEYSDLTVFSYHPVKMITTGEGGMIIGNNPITLNRIERLRSHGITRNVADSTHEPWRYEQRELGFNYRMTDIQAALGISQLTRLDEYVTVRRELAQWYSSKLEGANIILPTQSFESSWHLYVIQLHEAQYRNQIFTYLRQNGIGVNVHYIPVHLQPYYRELGFSEGDFPIAESYFKVAISLPLHPRLTELQQDYIVEKLIRVLN